MRFKTIVIAGVGGIGYYAAMLLSKIFSDRMEIHTFDPDNFEGGHGHERLPKVVKTSYNKVDMVRVHSIHVMGAANGPIPHAERFTADHFQGTSINWTEAILVDCTDMSNPDKKPIYDAARAAGIVQIFRGSFDGSGEMGVYKGLPFTRTGDSGAGYGQIPNAAHGFTAAGMLVLSIIRFFNEGKWDDIQISIPTGEEVGQNVEQTESTPEFIIEPIDFSEGSAVQE